MDVKPTLLFVALCTSLSACAHTVRDTAYSPNSSPSWVCAKDICFDDNSISSNNPMAYVTVLLPKLKSGPQKIDLSSDVARTIATTLPMTDTVHVDINCMSQQMFAPSGYYPLPYRFGRENLSSIVCSRAGLFRT